MDPHGEAGMDGFERERPGGGEGMRTAVFVLIFA
jgi:hypothetical protein